MFSYLGKLLYLDSHLFELNCVGQKPGVITSYLGTWFSRNLAETNGVNGGISYDNQLFLLSVCYSGFSSPYLPQIYGYHHPSS